MHRHVTFVKKIIKLENFGRYSKNGFTLVGSCNSVINRHWYNTGTNNPNTYHTQFPAKEEKESWAIQNFEDRLFNYLSDNGDRLSVQKFRTAIANYGLRDSDPRLKESMENLNNVQAQADLHGLFVDKNTFKDCIADNIVLIAKAFHNNFIIPDFPMFRQQIDDLYWKAKSNSTGRGKVLYWKAKSNSGQWWEGKVLYWKAKSNNDGRVRFFIGKLRVIVLAG
ncbi:GLS [Mytilus edulis]|uniref:GlsA n=1 Tax=Mytilus edulis TaxID=6550 RepID=A0A8S3SW95_MYTED|nr:GLS [Mytilus edulis]